MTSGDGKPCKKCGTDAWYQNGNCKRCAKEYSQKQSRNNPIKNREYVRSWREKNPGKDREQSRRWAKENPDKANAKTQRRRTAKASGGGSYTSHEWKQLIKQQNGRCLSCGKETKLTVDHVIPISKGGTSNIDNIQGLCRSCNSSKGVKSTDYRSQKGLIRWIQNQLF